MICFNRFLALALYISFHLYAYKNVSIEQIGRIIDVCGVENKIAVGENFDCPRAKDFINEALRRYNLDSGAQKAFYLSTMAIESGNLSFNKKHFPKPGRPGQGTRSMMMPSNLYAFAKSSNDVLKENYIIKGLVKKSYDENNDQAKNLLLNELMKDEYSFLPGAWWMIHDKDETKKTCFDLSNKLCPGNKELNKTVSEFLTACVGVETNQERMDAFQVAFDVLQ